MIKKVLVSGCFDMLHSGHIAFLRSAAIHGDVYVCIGSDQTVYELKKRYPVNTENERKFMLEALRDVHEVCVSSGSGYLDFLPELDWIKPDIFVVNKDGFSKEKEQICIANGIELIVLEREPHAGLPTRSTTELRKINNIPFRIDIAGGWLDQPFVSMHAKGAVITISIEPEHDFNERSGMASSTRKIATDLWKNQLPEGKEEQLAKLLFAYENPPGKSEVAGSQDAIGIVFSGLNKSNYEGTYWPKTIDSVHDEGVIHFIEKHLYLVSLGPRKNGYDVLARTNIDKQGAQALAKATEECWEAILHKDLPAFGMAFTRSFEAQVKMFPEMADEAIYEMIAKYRPCIGLEGKWSRGWRLFDIGIRRDNS
jgi:cytidyltransferase-like protein